MILYFYLKTKPFKQESGLVYINGFIRNYDFYGNEYEIEEVITIDIDFYLDLLLLKPKYNKYSFVNVSKNISTKSVIVSGADKKGDYKLLEKL